MVTKFFVILFSAILIMSSAIAQDSLRVSVEEWKFIEKTYLETDSALVDCESLNKLYENRMTLFQMQVADLENANNLCDTLLVKKDKQLELRQEQVALINAQLKKMKFEIWIWRGIGILALVAGVAIAL